MNKIILYVHPSIVINGILFYCIEHFLYLRSKNIDITFNIIYSGDFNEIVQIINDKYIISESDLNKIYKIKLFDLIKYKTEKALILDTNTYNYIEKFNSKINKIFLYSNDNNYTAREQDDVYGFYHYQKFNIKERLKLGLQFMKPKKQTIYKSFCSFPIEGIDKLDKQKVYTIASYDVVFKDFVKDLNMLCFKEIIYYHSKNIDRNNRLIPECFYFNINLVLVNNENTNDSINERYNYCLNNGVDDFIIDDNYKLLNDFIKE